MVLIAVALFSLGNSSDMFLVMRAQSIGIPVSLAPLLGLVFNVTYTLGSWPAGWFSDHFSAAMDRGRGISDFFRSLFRFRAGAVNAGYLDHDGDLWLVLRPDAAGVEGAGC